MSAEAGHNVTVADIPFFRYCYLAETEEQARQDAYKSLNWVIDLLQWRGTLNGASEASNSIDEWRRTRGNPSLTFDHVTEHRSIIGTPEQCVEKIKALQAQGVDYFGCNFAFGGMPRDKVKATMRLFGEEVMPHFD